MRWRDEGVVAHSSVRCGRGGARPADLADDAEYGRQEPAAVEGRAFWERQLQPHRVAVHLLYAPRQTQTALAYVRTRLHCCWDGSTESILLAAHAGAGGGNCHNGTHICDVGQNFLWFTQGTSIGCAAPDGHLGNNRSEQGNDRDRCGSGMKPTNNDPRFRTFNRDVPAMSAQDRYVSSLGQSGPSRTVLPGGVCSFD